MSPRRAFGRGPGAPFLFWNPPQKSGIVRVRLTRSRIRLAISIVVCAALASLAIPSTWIQHAFPRNCAMPCCQPKVAPATPVADCCHPVSDREWIAERMGTNCPCEWRSHSPRTETPVAIAATAGQSSEAVAIQASEVEPPAASRFLLLNRPLLRNHGPPDRRLPREIPGRAPPIS